MASKDKDLSLVDYRQRLIYFKDADAERNKSERGQRRILQSRVEDLEALTVSRSGRFKGGPANREPFLKSPGFILVLIDADADDYAFHEKFLSRNEAGGRDAADELQARTKDYVKNIKLDAENTDITVRAYADLKSLRSACVRNGRMKESSSMSLFAHGLN
ncbi:hypothetical protein HO133_006671 [Letharia lupina]|uniref:DUF7923 domain-containing protein n=1 Tax=Letharia lupina TaxID=560253 RepID=A0A8H6C6M0_9LECA|nr:uncharacterized protein HO133_006671 [Letharia lupina]KAF6217569.1 hypothetical protein HO133_006671 [Letharia lupina]